MGFDDCISAPVTERSFTFGSLFIGDAKPLVLQARHAGFSNAGLTAAQLKSYNERQARRGGGATGGSVTPEMIEADRVVDCKLFAKHVVTGWAELDKDGKPLAGSTTVYEDGKAVPFSVAKCEELLLAISKKRLDLFRMFTGWASSADNFTDAPPLGDPADLGK